MEKCKMPDPGYPFGGSIKNNNPELYQKVVQRLDDLGYETKFQWRQANPETFQFYGFGWQGTIFKNGVEIGTFTVFDRDAEDDPLLMICHVNPDGGYNYYSDGRDGGWVNTYESTIHIGFVNKEPIYKGDVFLDW